MIALGYGTRPQVIKVARLLPALRQRWRTFTIDTGQHYDYEMHRLQYEQLGVAPPDALLEVGSGPRAEQIAMVQERCEGMLRQVRPSTMVVIGDTNSTLGCALAAESLGIPIVHVEAGLRSHTPMAEEENRREVDGRSALLCAPSAAAVRWIEAEGLSGRVEQTGDVARDVLEEMLRVTPDPALPADWPVDRGVPFGFATLHRAELTDDADTLAGVLDSLGRCELPMVLALHPRTRARIEEWRLRVAASVLLRMPLGYRESIAAARNARVVVTDSGGVQREAYWLGIPCVTARAETEWVETVELGANRLVSPALARRELASAVASALHSDRSWNRDALGTGRSASAIADAIGASGLT